METDGSIDRRIAFIGAGNMAEAIMRGLLDRGVFPKNNILISDISKERLEFLRNQWGVTPAEGNAPAADGADIIVLSVKPQQIAEVLAEVRGAVSPGKLVISIAAGTPTETIEQALDDAARVIRVMPNTPALVGKGASAYCTGRRATEEDARTAECLLSAVGVVYRVEEKDMDAVTALSGSGPAYFFYMLEAMLSAAVKMGLDRDCAFHLAAATCEGAGALLRAMERPPEELRRRVTSRGGTTEAAVAVLDEAGIQAVIEEALHAAARRSRERITGAS